MNVEKLAEQVQDFIIENDQRAAADLLMQTFRGKNPQLFNSALIQQSSIKKLTEQSLSGVLSYDEINRERAKINTALLQLTDEYARWVAGDTLTAEPVSVPAKAFPPWAGWAGAALIVLTAVIWVVKSSTAAGARPKTFDVEVRVHEFGREEIAIQEGQVNLRLGEAVPQEPRTLDATGKAIFRDLSEKYRGDSVLLLYFPLQHRPYKIHHQSAATLTGENQTIRFALEFLPETTVFEATLRDSKGRAIHEAQITIDGALHTLSDARGYFKIAVPKPNGATAHVVIEKNGKRIFEQDLTISPGHKAIPIE